LQRLLVETIRARLQAEDLTGRLRGPRAEQPESAAPSPEPTFDFALPEAPAPPAPTTRSDLLPPSPVAPTPPRASPPVRGTDRHTRPPREVPPPAEVVPPLPLATTRESESVPPPGCEENLCSIIRALQLHDTYLVVEVA